MDVEKLSSRAPESQSISPSKQVLYLGDRHIQPLVAGVEEDIRTAPVAGLEGMISVLEGFGRDYGWEKTSQAIDRDTIWHHAERLLELGQTDAHIRTAHAQLASYMQRDDADLAGLVSELRRGQQSIHETEVLNQPDAWGRTARIYHILLEDGFKIDEWLQFYGVTEKLEGSVLQKLKAALPVLKEHGFDTLFLTGVFLRGQDGKKGEFGSPYSIREYEVDPKWGTTQELIELNTLIREMGMHSVTDIVMNHTARDHEWTRTHPEYYLPCQPGSEHCTEINGRSFQHGGCGWINNETGEVGHSDYDDVLQLDLRNPELRAAMKGVAQKLVGELGFDGLRVDMAAHLSAERYELAWGVEMTGPEFLSEIITSTQQAFPERGVVFLAETWNEATLYWLGRVGFQATYNLLSFPGSGQGWLGGLGSRNPKTFARAIELDSFMVGSSGPAPIDFIGTHDTPAPIMTFARQLQLNTVMTLFSPGCFLWLYGTEVGDYFVADKDRRDPSEMPGEWKPFPLGTTAETFSVNWQLNPKLGEWTREMFKLRAQVYEELGPNPIDEPLEGAGVYGWVGRRLISRQNPELSYVIIANPTPQPIQTPYGEIKARGCLLVQVEDGEIVRNQELTSNERWWE